MSVALNQISKFLCGFVESRDTNFSWGYFVCHIANCNTTRRTLKDFIVHILDKYPGLVELVRKDWLMVLQHRSSIPKPSSLVNKISRIIHIRQEIFFLFFSNTSAPTSTIHPGSTASPDSNTPREKRKFNFSDIMQIL